MNDDDDKHALRNAQELVKAVRLYEARGDTQHAEKVQRRAEGLYEDAGLDPAWHDDESRWEAMDEERPTLSLFILDSGQLELTENPDPEADISGIVFERDSLVDLEP